MARCLYDKMKHFIGEQDQNTLPGLMCSMESTHSRW